MNNKVVIIALSFFCVACGGGVSGGSESQINTQLEPKNEASSLLLPESEMTSEPVKPNTDELVGRVESIDTKDIQASSDFLFKSIQQVQFSFSESAKSLLGQARVYLSICELADDSGEQACLFQGFVDVASFSRVVRVSNSVEALDLKIWHGDARLQMSVATWLSSMGNTWQINFQ